MRQQSIVGPYNANMHPYCNFEYIEQRSLGLCVRSRAHSWVGTLQMNDFLCKHGDAFEAVSQLWKQNPISSFAYTVDQDHAHIINYDPKFFPEIIIYLIYFFEGYKPHTKIKESEIMWSLHINDYREKKKEKIGAWGGTWTHNLSSSNIIA